VTIFWFFAGVLVTLACLTLMLPWLRKIPRLGPLPAVPWQLAAGAALMIAVVLGLYRWLGRPDLAAQPAAHAPLAANSAAALSGTANSASSAGSMDAAIASLQARLAKGGGSADDWELLAKSYDFLSRPEDAAKARAHQLPSAPGNAAANGAAASNVPGAIAPTLSAESSQLIAKASRARQDKKLTDAAAIYAQLAARGQMSADAWADYADTAATLRGKLVGEPETYIAKALALDPKHAKALWLKASADEEAGRFAAAALAWQRLLAVLPPDSADAKIVAANFQNDAKLSGGASAESPSAPAGTLVTGEASLAAALSAKAAPGATLFIVAKSVDSPGAPVAVLRSSVGTWPAKFTLDDSLAMIPGHNLSSAGRVTIEARISQSGQPLPAAGDLQGSSGVINPADRTPLKILIDRVIP
jgi:hypothetical protein